MKKLSLLLASLFIALSAGMVQADDAGSDGNDKYIPWTWDDIKD